MQIYVVYHSPFSRKSEGATRRVEIGIDINMLTISSVHEALQVFSLADSAGFSSACIVDSQFYANDPYPVLGAAASRTERIKLGTMVTNPITRFPSVTASAISTLDEISSGRAFLGFGLGYTAVIEMGIKPATIQRCRKAINEIRDLCNGRVVEYNGHKAKFRTPTKNVPIYLACSAEKTQKLAGEITDGAILNLEHYGDSIKNTAEVVRNATASSGRNSDSFKLICLTSFCVSEDRRRARSLLKPCIGRILLERPDILRAGGVSGEALQHLQEQSKSMGLYENDLTHSQDWERASENLKFIPDEISDKFAVGGSPEDFVRRIMELERLGFDEVIFRPPFTRSFKGAEADQRKIVRIFGEQVIPEFK